MDKSDISRLCLGARLIEGKTSVLSIWSVGEGPDEGGGYIVLGGLVTSSIHRQEHVPSVLSTEL